MNIIDRDTLLSHRNYVLRFWSKVDKSGDCWNWTAHRSKQGYGQTHTPYNRAHVYVHRVAWTIVRGNIPNGMLVLHKCDNPSCVNPDHLFLGNHRLNTQDMIEKGRNLNAIKAAMKRKGYKLTPETKAKMSLAKIGDKHPRACKVTIKGITYPTQTAAANALGITRQAIHYMVKNGLCG